MQAIISIKDLNKVYAGKKGQADFQALKDINLDIKPGEIFALLGPNGAGKTTLISTICGIVNATDGQITVAGHDIVRDYRQARSQIGLVPQEIAIDIFETVWKSVVFSRGLFGLPPKPDYLEQILRDLSLWDKKDNMLRTLSGGMKRRLMIAKALAHEPQILFLDEPTAGVDVELRKDMWAVVQRLKDAGVTIILTTHYLEEAEAMADRVGVIQNGEIILVEDKTTLMKKMGKKVLRIDLYEALREVPSSLASHQLELAADGKQLIYHYDTAAERTGITALLNDLRTAGIEFNDLDTEQSSLEEIFVSLTNN